MYYISDDVYSYPSVNSISNIDQVEINSLADVPVTTALSNIVTALGLQNVGPVGNALLLLFGVIIGPIIAVGVTIPIVSIVYSALYLPAFGLLKSKEIGFGMEALMDYLNDANPFGRSIISSMGSVLESQECTEQISCQMGKLGRENYLEGLFYQ